jgi:hypothetical protein
MNPIPIFYFITLLYPVEPWISKIELTLCELIAGGFLDLASVWCMSVPSEPRLRLGSFTDFEKMLGVLDDLGRPPRM